MQIAHPSVLQTRLRLSLPAFGLKGTLNMPPGVRSSGVDFELISYRF
jgi:hypothetical protein